MEDNEQEISEVTEQASPEITEETPQTPQETPEQAAEEQPRHPIYDRVKGYFPDKTFEKDEDYLEAVAERLNSLETYQSENETANQKVIEALNSEPLLVKIMQDIGEGATFIEAIAQHLDPSDLELSKGDPGYEKWAENKAKREAEAKANKEFMDEVNANVASSQTVYKEFQEENSLSDDKLKEVNDTLQSWLADAYKGKVSKQTLNLILKAITSDEKIADAAEEAEIKGRNQAIEVKKEKSKPSTPPVVPSVETPPTQQSTKPKSYAATFMDGVL